MSAAADHDRRYMRDESRPPPWCLMWLLLLVLRLVNWLQTAMLPPALRIADMAFGGHSMAEVVRTTAALGLADQLAQGPKTALALARDIGANAERLYRLLRFATAHGIFTASCPSDRQQGPETTFFCNNRLSACLREDHPNCQRHVILNCVGGQYLSGGWALLEWGVRTGGPIFEKAYGEPFFEHCKSHPHLEENFSKAMTDIDHSCGNSILQDYPWTRYQCYVDIAGAYGSFMADLLAMNPQSIGILFDQPHVISRAEAMWRDDPKRQAIAKRTSFASGDFFKPETLPCIKQAGSAWILRQICHDWPDQQVLQILKSVRAAMGAAKPPCTLCLVEMVILGAGSPTADYRDRVRTASDLQMMINHDGKERDAAQWAELLTKAGFQLKKIIPTRSLFSIVEAVPSTEL
ncbi:hypothetical protein CVIRNUC_002712 [Coccomyxa viridis]|uniref:O-methyltransferase domain-containing protein n=1 Tax=Coccomyxa viridis TaxID=1274662 RepID=A0AAV1HWZ9_9CHLO|nr:hypothetical protein CVIRNUC_002712 [Coccomyxa viridis]